MFCIKKRKKGQFFEVDALIAITLLVIGLIYVRGLQVEQPVIKQNEQFSQESVKLLRSLLVADLDPNTITELELSDLSEFTDRNFSLSKQIAIYYFQGNQSLAENLSRKILDDLIPSSHGYSVVIRSDGNESVIYQRGVESPNSDLSVARTMITGLQQTKPIIGKLARLFLGNVRNLESEYVFFGGYTGQGDITFNVSIPQDSAIRDIYFEGIVGGNVSVQINDLSCGRINKTEMIGSLNGITKTFLNCNQLLNRQENRVKFVFESSDIIDQYVGGGYVRVRYENDAPEQGSQDITKPIMGVEGVINTYDSFFVDGELDNLSIFLHFNNSKNSFFYVTLDETRVFQENKSGEFRVLLDNLTLQTMFNFTNLSNRSVPLRIATTNVSGFADIALILDRSNEFGNCLNDGKAVTSDGGPIASDLSNFNHHEWVQVGSEQECLNNCEDGHCFYDDNTHYYDAGFVEQVNLSDVMVCSTHSYYNWSFENSFDGWSTGLVDPSCHEQTNQNSWGIYNESPNGQGFVSTGIGVNGSAMHLGCEYSFVQSPLLDLTTTNDIELSFISWTNNTGICGHTNSEYVQVSEDGIDWINLSSCNDSLHIDVDDVRRKLIYNLTDYQNKNVFIRFVFDTGVSASYSSDDEGWVIDDVVISDARDILSLSQCEAINFPVEQLDQGLVYDTNSCVESYCYYESLNRECISCNPVRMSRAKTLATQLVNNVVGFLNNNVAVIGAAQDMDSCNPQLLSLTNNKTNATQTISEFDASCGESCLSCAINRSFKVLNSQNKKFMVLISGGNTTHYFEEDGSVVRDSHLHFEVARNHTINLSAAACEVHNITLFAIGLTKNMSLLNASVQANKHFGCNATLIDGSQSDSLSELYKKMTEKIQFVQQGINSTAININSTIHPDSYIKMTTLKKEVSAPEDSIIFTSETESLNLCTDAFVDLSGFLGVRDAQVISYTNDLWTESVVVNGEKIFSLRNASADLREIGDPSVIGIPKIGEEKKFTISSSATDGFLLSNVCSPHNKLIYNAYLPRTYSLYSEFLIDAEGCSWNVSFSDGTDKEIKIPAEYSGNRDCHFYDKVYDENNVLDKMMFDLLNQLDANKQGASKGKVDISIEQEDIEIDTQTIEQIPFLWGPAVLEVRVWR